MRILLLTHYYEPETGAPQLRWSSLVQEFTRAGHHVDVIAPVPHYPLGRLLDGHEDYAAGVSHEGRHGETVHRVRFCPTKGTVGSHMVDQAVVATATVARALRARKVLAPDVVIATAPALPTLAAGWAVGKALRIPVVMEMRDAWPDLLAVVDRWDGSRAPRRAKVKRGVSGVASWGITRLQRSADYVVATTASFARVLESRGVERVTVVRNASHPVSGYDRHEPREADGELRITYVGTVGRAQGIETAVRAMRRVQEAGLKVSMRIIGSGSGKALVQQEATRLGVPVVIRGVQPRSTIHEHYRWADTFLIMLQDWKPLTWTVPSKLLEALAIGMHVSGSVEGEAAEIITSTGAGFAVRPRDDEALAKEWIKLAHNLPARPDREQMASWVEENGEEGRNARIFLDVLRSVVPAGVA